MRRFTPGKGNAFQSAAEVSIITRLEKSILMFSYIG